MEKVTTEKLAQMVQKGFTELGEKMDKRFEAVDKRFEAIDQRFEAVDKRFVSLETRTSDGFTHVNARLATIERDVAEIRKHFVYRDEFEDLMARVKYLETKLKIKSGK